MCFVLAGEGPLGHNTEGVCRAYLDNSLCGFLAENDILGFNPPDRRGELVCEEFDEEGVGELLLDFGAHGGGLRKGAEGLGIKTRSLEGRRGHPTAAKSEDAGG